MMDLVIVGVALVLSVVYLGWRWLGAKPSACAVCPTKKDHIPDQLIQIGRAPRP